MRLAILTDHRLQRGVNLEVRSGKHYSPQFFAERYLGHFDNIVVVARVDDNSYLHLSWGDRVDLVTVGDWNSLRSLCFRYNRVLGVVRDVLGSVDAAIGIAPSLLSTMAANTRCGVPYGLEVVGDPFASLAPGTIKHFAQGLVRASAAESLRDICRRSVATSYVTLDALQRLYPGGPDTACFACSDVELPDEAFAAIPRSAPRADSEITLVNVGTMTTSYKRQDLLISAVADCREAGRRIRLKLIGDGQYRSLLMNQVRQLDLTNNVEFLGNLAPGKAVRDQLDTSDVFVLPSMTEGCPRALLEAMARGMPCLGSNVGGIPDLLEPASLFEANSREALTKAVMTAIESPVLRYDWGARNLEFSKAFHKDRLALIRQQFLQSLAEHAAIAKRKRAA